MLDINIFYKPKNGYWISRVINLSSILQFTQSPNISFVRAQEKVNRKSQCALFYSTCARQGRNTDCSRFILLKPLEY